MIRATATAASVPGTDDYCVVSLENTTKTGINASGNADIDHGLRDDHQFAFRPTRPPRRAARASPPTVIAAAGGIQQSNNWNVGKYDPYVAGGGRIPMRT